jgi:mannobiose 2-epimerase
MTEAATLDALRTALKAELTQGILPYWMDRAVDARHGGFVGAITGDDVPVPLAAKGSVLTARILWTFAAAYHALGDGRYHETAERAADFFLTHFLDPLHGGVYWMVDADGAPRDERKHVYAQAFAIYALSEYYRATGHEESLRVAIGLFRLVERHAHDAEHGGYEEAFSRAWVRLDDVRLGDGDADERKSMNTHLHVLEGYTNLYRSWPDPMLGERIRDVIELFLAHIIDSATGHGRQFFDGDWSPKSGVVSFGHDIEASWLLLKGAEAIGDDLLRRRVAPVSVRMADAVLLKAFDATDGGVFYEMRPDGALDTDKEWWPQAEAIVGFVNAYQETGRGAFLQAAWETWRFTTRHVVDHTHGEWHRRVTRNGVVCAGLEKAGPWKCPYHNARACLEVMARAATTGQPHIR